MTTSISQRTDISPDAAAASGEFSAARIGAEAEAQAAYSFVRVTLQQSPSGVRIVRSGPKPKPAPPKGPTPEEQQAAARAVEEQNERLTQQLNYLQELLNSVGGAVEDLQQQHRASLTEMQQAAVELSVVAASWIVGAAIDADMFAVDDLVAQMVAQLHREQPIRIFLNPDDVTLLEHLRNSSDVPQFAAAEVEFVPEPALARGICRAESSRTTLMTDMDDRLAEIRRIWMENLNDTQAERRTDDPSGRRFRRFPDRRHTA
ncbi:MAG: hypothetical protein KDA81_13650 [Planctomycetaceae bacterium]|nr:hypothetical protein [Planctomycetaceae bacterium]